MYLKVTVFPDFKKELIEKVDAENITMYLREAPERGQANKRVLKILNELFPNKRIRIVSGAKAFKKLIEVK